jgi:hypothetical protein
MVRRKKKLESTWDQILEGALEQKKDDLGMGTAPKRMGGQ